MGQDVERTSAPEVNRYVSHSAAIVNRTHRVVRERAKTLNEQKSRARSLWIPLTISFGLLALLMCALWSLMDESEFLADGLPDASQSMLVVSMWFLPLSAVLLAVIWFRRTGAHRRDQPTDRGSR